MTEIITFVVVKWIEDDLVVVMAAVANEEFSWLVLVISSILVLGKDGPEEDKDKGEKKAIV